MAKYMDLKDMLKQGQNDSVNKGGSEAKTNKSKSKKFNQYDNGLAILSRLGRAILKSGGVAFSATKKVYKKAKSSRTIAKSYKKSRKALVSRAARFLVKQVGKLDVHKISQNMVNYAKYVNYTKVIPARVKGAGRNKAQYIKLNRAFLPATVGRKKKMDNKNYALFGQIAQIPQKTTKKETNTPVFKPIINTRAPEIREAVGIVENIKKRWAIRNAKALEFDYQPLIRYKNKCDQNGKMTTVMVIKGQEYPVGTKIYIKSGNDKKTQKSPKKQRKIVQKSHQNGKIAVGIVKKTLPFALAMLPGGFAVSLTINKYQQQLDIFNQMSIEIANQEATRAARESFVNAINSIDGKKWMYADDNASALAQNAYDDYLAANPADLDGAKGVYDQVFSTNMQQSLGLTPEQYVAYKTLHDPIATECEKNIDQWLEAGWQSLGYKDDIDAMEKNPELFEAYLNDEEWAVKAWDEMVEKVSSYYLDAGVFDVMKSQANDFANQNIYALGKAAMTSLSDFIAMNPELGVVGAVGALGVGAATYCVSRAAVRKVSKDNDSASNMNEGNSESSHEHEYQ